MMDWVRSTGIWRVSMSDGPTVAVHEDQNLYRDRLKGFSPSCVNTRSKIAIFAPSVGRKAELFTCNLGKAFKPSPTYTDQENVGVSPDISF